MPVAVTPAEPAAMVAMAAMPIDPPISWPVVFSPDKMPVSSSAAPVITDTETDTRTRPSPMPAISMPGSRSVR